MQCPECGHEIPDRVSLCPRCGVMVEETQPTHLSTTQRVQPKRSKTGEDTGQPGLNPLVLWGAAFVALLLLSVAGGAYLGLRRGEEERIQRLEQEAQSHYETGLQRLDEGNYRVAKAQFEYVLQLDPDHPQAEQGLAEAEARLSAELTPEATATAEPEEPIAEQLFAEASAHYEAERWQEAASALTSLRQLDPAYKPDVVEEMLFESRYRAGMVLLEEDDFELGIFYLDRAVALRPLDQEASDQRQLAQQYVEALSYWGADWERCIAAFEELYRTAPEYKDVFQRLYQAHVQYAEAWENQGELCPAVQEDAEALRLLNSSAVEDTRAAAGTPRRPRCPRLRDRGLSRRRPCRPGSVAVAWLIHTTTRPRAAGTSTPCLPTVGWSRWPPGRISPSGCGTATRWGTAIG